MWGGLLIGSSALTTAITALVESEKYFLSLFSQEWVIVFRLLLALFVPICAATVTFLKYESRATRHHDAAAGFASLKR